MTHPFAIPIAQREAGDHVAAVAWLQHYLATRGDHPQALAHLAHLHLLRKREGEAAPLLARAAALAPDDPLVLRNRARLALQTKKTDEAAQAITRALALSPTDPENRLVAVAVLAARGQGSQAMALVNGLLADYPAYAEALVNRALLYMQSGALAAAVADARRALEVKPHLSQVWRLLATLHLRGQQRDEALTAFQHYCRLEPGDADALADLGELLRQAQRNPEALEVLARACALKPDLVAARVNLGVALQQAGRIPEAKDAYGQALALNPHLAEVASNLGAILKGEGDLTAALAHFEQACTLDPQRPELHANRGSVLLALGRYQEAEQAARQSLALDPGHLPALRQLAAALEKLGRSGEALRALQRVVQQSPEDQKTAISLALHHMKHQQWAEAIAVSLQVLQIQASETAKALFVNCVKRGKFDRDNPQVRGYLVQSLVEPWCRPGDIAAVCISLIKLNPAVARHLGAPGERLLPDLAGDSLLLPLLSMCPIPDPELERLLSEARGRLLDLALAEGEPTLLPLACAVAGQCFINEYIYACSAAEKMRLEELVRRLVESPLERMSPWWPVVVAAYRPLYALDIAPALLEKDWPAPLAALFRQQIAQPLEERAIRQALPRLTAVEDEVSLLVQQQYEEHPYPRWTHVPDLRDRVTLGGYIRGLFPHGPWRDGGGSGLTEMLIAGCGTGLQAVEKALLFKDTRILAVDLSLASLGYAVRQSRALGLDNLTFAQADILQLAGLPRSFDFIESTGVLHHMGDPWRGWRVLLSLLRPGGVMTVGLYSETARQSIVAIRRFIAEQGFGAIPEDIHRCRQALLAMAPDSPLRQVAASPDFYCTSTCRDLLFHVQEHRMTLPVIQEFLTENRLQFIGFIIDHTIKQRYGDLFPEDRQQTDLALWHRFELTHPQTFGGMYQFMVQK